MRLLAFLLFTGLAYGQTVHSNDLSWTAPVVTAGQVISGYNVYRAKTPGAYVKGTPLVKLTAGQTTYSDLGPGMKAADVNYYVITALCAVCNPVESPFSVEIKATTPADAPGPPIIQSNTFTIISR